MKHRKVNKYSVYFSITCVRIVTFTSGTISYTSVQQSVHNSISSTISYTSVQQLAFTALSVDC
jgi:hypothetical protein